MFYQTSLPLFVTCHQITRRVVGQEVGGVVDPVVDDLYRHHLDTAITPGLTRFELEHSKRHCQLEPT